MKYLYNVTNHRDFWDKVHNACYKQAYKENEIIFINPGLGLQLKTAWAFKTKCEQVYFLT